MFIDLIYSTTSNLNYSDFNKPQVEKCQVFVSWSTSNSKSFYSLNSLNHFFADNLVVTNKPVNDVILVSFIVNFEQISRIVLVFLFLTLSK